MSTTHAYRSAPMTPLHHFMPVYDPFNHVIEDERTLCSTPHTGGSFNYDTYLPKTPSTPPSIHFNVNVNVPSRPTPPPTVNFNLPISTNLNHPTSVNPHRITPPAQIIDLGQVNPYSTVPPPLSPSQPSQLLVPPIMPSAKKDMHMAKAGTDSALAGIDTPIAGHVAQLIFWFWFAVRSPVTSPPTPPAEPTAADLATDEPFHALCVTAPDGFSSFVSHILHLTQVSHSVVLLSILYVRRMSKLFPSPAAGSEKIAFIIGLMLGNKFLDDNTYTNRTWADLSKISIQVLNTVELEALRLLRWDLTVNQSEFRKWSQLLDRLIFRHNNSPTLRIPTQSHLAMSTPGVPTTPFTFRPPRARTQSPPELQIARPPPVGHATSPPRQRKRSACDAFSMEAVMAEQQAKSMRVPERRGYADLPGAPVTADRPATSTASSLNRAASLNRSGLRPPSVNSRRGSIPGLAASPMVDMPMPFVQYQNQPIDYRQSAMMAPNQGQYQLAPPPPQGMVFYSLAADPHPGQDGHRRKATLHYQAPQPYYPNQPTAGGYSQPGYPVSNYQISPTASFNPYTTLNQEPISHLAPIPGQYDGTQQFGQPAIPAPANFANAGPPGYQYEQEMQYRQTNPSYAESQYHPSYQIHTLFQPGPSFHGQRRSIGSNGDHPAQYQQGAPAQTRSEWSSPMPGYPSYGW